MCHGFQGIPKRAFEEETFVEYYTVVRTARRNAIDRLKSKTVFLSPIEYIFDHYTMSPPQYNIYSDWVTLDPAHDPKTLMARTGGIS
jgi:hypothetical protein